MSNYYAPCFYRIHFVGIPSYIELPWINAAPLNVYVILHYHLYFVKMFFRMFYFSEYGIGMFLFVFWLRNRPSIKYVHNWENGGRSLKICTGTYKKRGRAYHRDLFDKLNFSEYDIRMFLFVFWLKNRPSIKYVRKWGKGGGSSKMSTDTYWGRGGAHHGDLFDKLFYIDIYWACFILLFLLLLLLLLLMLLL